MEPRCVGAFGGYSGKAMQWMPDRNGLLACVVDGRPSALKLLFSFGASGDVPLCEIAPIAPAPPAPAAPPGQAPRTIPPSAPKPVVTSIPGWITLERDDGVARALISRAWPAVRVSHPGEVVAWRSSAQKVLGVRDGAPSFLGLPQSDGRISEPWLVFVDHGGGPEDVAILLTFTRRLRTLTRTADGYALVFEGPGAVHAMPLEGIKRYPRGERPSLQYLVSMARAWVAPLLAYPMTCRETASLVEDRVEITAQLTYELLSDDYGNQAEPLAPFPPAVAHAAQSGYPVILPADIVTTSVQHTIPTLYGPLWHVRGDRYTYSLPMSVAAAPSAARERSRATWSHPIREELARLVDSAHTPNLDYIDSALRVVTFLADALPDLTKKQADEAVHYVRETAVATLSTLKAAVEPVTSQSWWTVGKTWRSYYREEDPPWGKENERFDSEFYNGQALVALEAALRIDPSIEAEVLDGAQKLYLYHQIFWDWPTGSVLTQATGDGSNIDGVQFAWEGMGAMARLAARAGLTALHTDAQYRAARQEAALFAMWHHAAWVKLHDYAIGHLSGGRLSPEQVATEGPIDAYNEQFGAATLELTSFWECTNFLFYSNRPLLELYRRHGLLDRVRALEYEIMPRLHPSWQDGNAPIPRPDNGADHYGTSFTAAHLYARAALFNDDPTALFEVYRAAMDSAASKTWCGMHVPEVAGPLMLALLEVSAAEPDT